MSPFHRSRALGGPLRRPMAAPPSRVWELEQRLQKVCPLERPGYLGTAASALRRRPGSGIPHHRQHRGPGPSLRRRSAPQKGGQAAQALGRSRGGFSTKVHVSVDALGNPLRFILTGGQKHDITQAQGLIADHAGEYVIADKGYDSREFRQYILERGMRWNEACVRSYRHAPTVRNPKPTMLASTESGTWWNASSTRSSTIAGYSPGLRSWTPDTWASFTLIWLLKCQHSQYYSRASQEAHMSPAMPQVTGCYTGCCATLCPARPILVGPLAPNLNFVIHCQSQGPHKRL